MCYVVSGINVYNVFEGNLVVVAQLQGHIGQCPPQYVFAILVVVVVKTNVCIAIYNVENAVSKFSPFNRLVIGNCIDGTQAGIAFESFVEPTVYLKLFIQCRKKLGGVFVSRPYIAEQFSVGCLFSPITYVIEYRLGRQCIGQSPATIINTEKIIFTTLVGVEIAAHGLRVKACTNLYIEEIC